MYFFFLSTFIPRTVTSHDTLYLAFTLASPAAAALSYQPPFLSLFLAPNTSQLVFSCNLFPPCNVASSPVLKLLLRQRQSLNFYFSYCITFITFLDPCIWLRRLLLHASAPYHHQQIGSCSISVIAPYHLLGSILLLLGEEVGAPVRHVKEGEHDGEGDAGDDVDPLAARWELGQPGTAAVLARRRQVDLTRPTLVPSAHAAVVP